MAQYIPLIPSVPNYRMNVVLDGTTYVMDVRWNGRDEAWYFDLSKADETIMLAGIKIVLGALLGIRSVDTDWPRGIFSAIDQSGAGIDATLDDIGVRVLMTYVPAAEALAL